MDFSLAIEALKFKPLTSDPKVYDAVRSEILGKDEKNILPQFWAWLAQIQEINGEKPTEAAIQAVALAANHLVKNKKSLSVGIEVLAKLLMNVLLKLLTVCPAMLCKDLYEIVGKIKPKPSRISRCFFLNLQVCNMKINSCFDEKEFYKNWLQLSGEDPPKAEYFLSLVLHTWSTCPSVTVSVWNFFRDVYDEQKFLEKFVDKIVPKLLLNHAESLNTSLTQLKVPERTAWRIVCHSADHILEDLVENKDVANRIITINKCLRDEKTCDSTSPLAGFTPIMKEEIGVWLRRMYPFFKTRLNLLGLLSEFASTVEDTRLACHYTKLAYDASHISLALNFLSRASGPEVTKMLYGMGGELVKRGSLGDAALIFDQLLGCEDVAVNHLMSIYAVYARTGLFDKARTVLAVAIRKDPQPSLIERYCSMPVTDMDWSDTELLDRVLPIAVSGKAHPSLIAAILGSQLDHVIYYKHLYYLKNYRYAPLEELLAESQSRPESLPNGFCSMWSFALGQDPRLIDGDCDLAREYNQLVHVYEETFVSLVQIHIGKRLEVIGELHCALSDVQAQLKNTPRSGRSFLSDSIMTLRIVGLLTRLSHAYMEVGVWKPTRAYLCQAMDLCKSLWPKREELWRGIEGALYELDVSATGSSDLPRSSSNRVSNWITNTSSSQPGCLSGSAFFPVIYSAVSEEGLGITQEAYTMSSPHEFKQTVLRCLANRSLPIREALGLLFLSNSLPFDLRDRVGRKAFDEPFPMVTNWSELLCKFASCYMSDPVLAFIYDEIGQNLVMANFQSQKILIVPSATLRSLRASLDELLDENKAMLFKKKNQEDVSSAEYKRSWWKSRQSLDSALGKIAAQLDTDLLFFFKALFKTNVSEEKIERMKAALAAAFPGFTSAAETLLLYGPTPKASVLESLLPLVTSTFPLENKAKTIKELRRCFEKTFIDEDVFCDAPVDVPIPDEILLVLDKNLHLLPWEVTPTLRNIRVYRQTSFWHLQRQIAARLQDDSVSYILNPGGDLRQTEAFFTERLRSNWRGIVGRPPQEQEFLESLTNSNLFMYFGHGGGDAYVKGTQIRALPKVAPSFLIGCSSGRIKTLGPFCPEGTFLNYLYAGCPTMLVNLWDVTDKDIDKFTDCMLTKLRLYQDDEKENNDEANLAEAVDDARQVCFLRHLNGAAPVIYGIPFV